MNDHLRAVLELLPNAFHRVGAAGDILHAPIGLSSGMRGLLLSLKYAGPTSVPRLAAMRPVSRQFVQKLVDEMVAGGWVEASANPSHKRSPLIGLTPKGVAAVEQLYLTEEPYLATLGEGFSQEELEITIGVLRAICDRLNPDALEALADDLANAATQEKAHA
jgi:DNA-binding MarR family transcriptional regulator